MVAITQVTTFASEIKRQNTASCLHLRSISRYDYKMVGLFSSKVCEH